MIRFRILDLAVVPIFLLSRGGAGQRLIATVAPLGAAEQRPPIAALITIHDESEQHRLLEMRTDFIANASHELRTPINVILGFSDIIMNRLFGPGAMDRYVEYAGDIHTAGNHLLAIIQDILDLSKIEAGQGSLDESDVRAATIAHETARILFRDRFERAGLTLAVQAMAAMGEQRRRLQAIAHRAAGTAAVESSVFGHGQSVRSRLSLSRSCSAAMSI